MTALGRLGTRRCVALLSAVALSLGACSDDGGASEETITTSSPETTTTEPTTTAPERPASTTTTAFDPATVEGQVEAAYLRSWDVYADAVYNLELDEAALAEIATDPYLSVLIDEIRGRIEDGRAALVHVEHNYTIEALDSETAVVIDAYRNHQRLIDPVTKEPVEADPNEVIVDSVQLKLINGTWKVARIDEVAR